MLPSEEDMRTIFEAQDGTGSKAKRQEKMNFLPFFEEKACGKEKLLYLCRQMGGRYVRYIPSPASKKGVFHSLFTFSKSIAGGAADTFYMTEQCFSKATGTQNKELYLIPDATHIKTYYVPEYVDSAVGKLTNFFNDNL